MVRSGLVGRYRGSHTFRQFGGVPLSLLRREESGLHRRAEGTRNMKRLTIISLVAVLTIGLLTANAFAASTPAVASMMEETAKGKITAVELDYHNFTMEVK